MKKMIRLGLSAFICLVFTATGISQKKLVQEFISSGQFKQSHNDRLAVLNNFERKSKTGDVTVFQFNPEVLFDSIFQLNIFDSSALNAVQIKKTIETAKEGLSVIEKGYRLK